ncbi:MAG: CpaF family protein [Candidatus Omnitrophica bacterium]|nr:CpaF family protein [Candidatus Omnitrophota bacterium]MBU2265538.1 CpaF family protein [Candidatus Omnitrophota bacterium]MBU2473857.1 CpaF family protein [Candidatus Omnitrophota bacterium]
MDLNKIKSEIRKEISLWIGDKQKLSEDFIRERAQLFFKHKAETGQYLDLKDADKEKLIKSLCADYTGLGPIQKLMEDEDITEIMINGPQVVYIEKNGKKSKTDVKFESNDHLRYIVEKMIQPTGRRVDESYPYVDFALENGSRVNVILPPLSVGGATVTIRKFLRSIEAVDDLIKLGTIDERMAEFLVACVRSKANILFSGATGSGKTTTLEVLSSYIDPAERIITIEDALELTLRQEHVVRLLTRAPNIEGKGEIAIRDLFCNTLRMRPTRIILGEIRGEEAMDYLQALNSGHKGSLAVIHASNPQDTLTRLETTALYASLNLPTWAIREQIAYGLDLIVQHEQLMDGSRKITYLTEVQNLNENQVVLQDIFRYQIEGVSEDFIVQGKFKAYGKPKFMHLFKRKGIKINEKIFNPD